MTSVNKQNYVIEDIKTEQGEEIIASLRQDKWKLSSQYSLFAFDKGIDFDFYRLKKNGEELYFEWDNWFEWKVVSSQNNLKTLANEYSLKSEIKPNN